MQLLTLAFGVAVLTVNAATAQMPAPTLVPEKIAMGTFYDGAHLRIEGTAPNSSGVLIVIRGAEKDEFFNRKGRVGPIWLNVDRIHIKQAPSISLSFSSAEISSLLDQATMSAYQLDNAAILSRIHCLCRCKCSLSEHAQQSGDGDAEPGQDYEKLLRAEFLSLKERDGSYRVRPHSVRVTTDANSRTSYLLEFDWPRKAPPGNYQVEVYACRGHQVIAHSAAALQLAEVGFPAYIANLAFASPWIYGAGAVLVALLAGFLTDALSTMFRGRKRRLPADSGTAASQSQDASIETVSADTHESETIHHG